MKPASAAFTFGILTTSLLAQQPPTIGTVPADFPTLTKPELFVAVEPGLVRFTVYSEYTPYVGIVLISALPNLANYGAGLPPLLDQSMILTFGYTDQPRFSSAIEETVFPPGVMWHVQGVVWSETGGILASGLESFVLDVTAPNLPPTNVDAVPVVPQDAPVTPVSADPKATQQQSDVSRPKVGAERNDAVPAGG